MAFHAAGPAIADRLADQPPRGAHATAAPRSAVTSREPYLNTQAGAEYLGYDVAADRARALKAFRQFVRRHNVPKFYRGTVLLFRRADLDRLVGA